MSSSNILLYLSLCTYAGCRVVFRCLKLSGKSLASSLETEGALKAVSRLSPPFTDTPLLLLLIISALSCVRNMSRRDLRTTLQIG